MSVFWESQQTNQGIVWKINKYELYEFLRDCGFGTFCGSSKRTEDGFLVQVDEGVIRIHTLKSMRSGYNEV